MGFYSEPSVDDESFQARIERGWCWGGEAFKEAVLGRLSAKANRTYRSSETIKDHGEIDALRIIEEAVAHFRIDEHALKTLRKGDLTRAAIAWRIFRETTVSRSWIAEQLNMKSAPNVYRQIRVFK